MAVLPPRAPAACSFQVAELSPVDCGLLPVGTGGRVTRSSCWDASEYATYHSRLGLSRRNATGCFCSFCFSWKQHSRYAFVLLS